MSNVDRQRSTNSRYAGATRRACWLAMLAAARRQMRRALRRAVAGITTRRLKPSAPPSSERRTGARTIRKTDDKKKGRPAGRPLQLHRLGSDVGRRNSSRIVHRVLDRVGRVLEADHLGHLQLDIAVDEIVIEDAAGFQEFAILVEIGERLAQAAAHGRDLLELL